jgi:hypothetical protein
LREPLLIFIEPVSLSSSLPAKRSEVLPAAFPVEPRPTGDPYVMHLPFLHGTVPRRIGRIHGYFARRPWLRLLFARAPGAGCTCTLLDLRTWADACGNVMLSGTMESSGSGSSAFLEEPRSAFFRPVRPLCDPTSDRSADLMAFAVPSGSSRPVRGWWFWPPQTADGPAGPPGSCPAACIRSGSYPAHGLVIATAVLSKKTASSVSDVRLGGTVLRVSRQQPIEDTASSAPKPSTYQSGCGCPARGSGPRSSACVREGGPSGSRPNAGLPQTETARLLDCRSDRRGR